MTPRRTRSLAALAAAASIAMVLALAACTSAPTTKTTTAPSAPATPSASTTSEESSENASIQTTSEEQNPVEVGRTVFTTGKDASGAIAFTQGLPAVKSKGVAACVDCHGTDGKGKKGLGPDITWTAIKGTFGTEALFSRAVTEGKDEKGAALKPAMPRFQMSPADVTAVYAYIKTL